MTRVLRRFADDQSGATAIEYGLLVSLLAVVIAGSLNNLGSVLWARLQLVASSLS